MSMSCAFGVGASSASSRYQVATGVLDMGVEDGRALASCGRRESRAKEVRVGWFSGRSRGPSGRAPESASLPRLAIPEAVPPSDELSPYSRRPRPADFEGRFRDLSREEAVALAAELDSLEVRRLKWLDDTSGLPRRTKGDMERLGLWLHEWIDDTSAADTEPPPPWGRYLELQPYPLGMLVGAEAVAMALRAACEATYPELQRGIGEPDTRQHNHPSLFLPGNPHPVLIHLWTTQKLLEWACWPTGWDGPGGGQVELKGSPASSFWLGVSRKVDEYRNPPPPPPPGPLVEVERADHEDYRWEVWLDDVLAHEHEELVAAFVTEMGELPGVKDAYHQDREQILVAGRITKNALSAWANEWWSERGFSGD